VPEESVWKVHGRTIQMHVVKEDKEADHWGRLCTDKPFEKRHVTSRRRYCLDARRGEALLELLPRRAPRTGGPNQVATDWTRYVDEDEEAGDDGFDMSALDGAASFGEAEGDEYEPDSDDDVDLADLEDEPPLDDAQ